jgi:hypothetical protein
MNAPTNNDVVMKDEEEPEGIFKMAKMLLSGQYTYITYLIMSSTCFFMWLTPNYNKLKMFFSAQPTQTTSGHNRRNSKRGIMPARTM